MKNQYVVVFCDLLGLYVYILCFDCLLAQWRRVNLDSGLEAQVWLAATQAYGVNLQSKLGQALSKFKRQPGLDDLTRVYPQAVGDRAFQALDSLLSEGAPETGRSPGDFIEVRYRLRWHLVHYLQRCLTDDGYATPAIRDDLFGTDLGL